MGLFAKDMQKSCGYVLGVVTRLMAKCPETKRCAILRTTNRDRARTLNTDKMQWFHLCTI
jgi:hypothetical protein